MRICADGPGAATAHVIRLLVRKDTASALRSHCRPWLRHRLCLVFPLPSVAKTLPLPCVSTAFRGQHAPSRAVRTSSIQTAHTTRPKSAWCWTLPRARQSFCYITLFTSFETPTEGRGLVSKMTVSPTAYKVLDLAKGGDLFDHIINEGLFTEQAAR